MAFFRYSGWKTVGCSVIGPKHKKQGTPNQDYYKIFHGSGYVIAVVSDGLGSHSHSDIGSKIACSSVINAVQAWLKEEKRKDSDLLRLIQTFWLMGIRPLDASTCGATCLWIVAWNTGEVLTGRLGDGVILVDTEEESPLLLEDKKEVFSNQTEALSERGILSKWEIRKISLKKGACICLMTDGISEDLNREKLPQVIKIFRQL